MTDDPSLPPPPPPPPPPGVQPWEIRTRSTLRKVGAALATVLIISGLAMLGFIVFIVIAMGSYGSNK